MLNTHIVQLTWWHPDLASCVNYLGEAENLWEMQFADHLWHHLEAAVLAVSHSSRWQSISLYSIRLIIGQLIGHWMASKTCLRWSVLDSLCECLSNKILYNWFVLNIMAGITLKSYSSHGQLLIFLILINHVLVKIISARNKQINSFPWWWIDGWMDGLIDWYLFIHRS